MQGSRTMNLAEPSPYGFDCDRLNLSSGARLSAVLQFAGSFHPLAVLVDGCDHIAKRLKQGRRDHEGSEDADHLGWQVGKRYSEPGEEEGDEHQRRTTPYQTSNR